jgi:NAD(P)-dependent dehydrogenase (short-subunit alcohol dehydrogenase family)
VVELDGRVGIVTGGSTLIGRAVVRELHGRPVDALAWLAHLYRRSIGSERLFSESAAGPRCAVAR